MRSLLVHIVEDHGNVIPHVCVIIYSCLISTNCGEQIAALPVLEIERHTVDRGTVAFLQRKDSSVS